MLVELMIAMVLGLLVIAGVGSLFLANKQAYQVSEGLSEYQ
jgi:type IV pilus assembly protein PilW